MSKLLGMDIGPGTRQFVHNLELVTIGFGLAKIISSSVAVLAGRLLGPHEFGLVNLSVAIGTLVYMMMLFGLNTTIVRYGSKAGDQAARRKVFSTAFHLVLGLAFVLIIAAFLFENNLTRIFGVDKGIYKLGILFALSFSLYAVTSAMYEALNRFRLRSMLELVFSATLAVVFVSLYFTETNRTHFSLCAGYISGYLAAFATGIIFIRHEYEFSLDFVLAKQLLRYGFYLAICGLAFFVIVNMQRIYINRILAPSEVGFFSAYALGSTNVGMIAATVFVTVFFPKASSSKNIDGIFRKLSKASSLVVLPSLIFICAFIRVIFALLGSDYPFNLVTALLFSIGAVLIWLVFVFGHLNAAYGGEGMPYLALAHVCGAIFSAVFSPKAIRAWGLNGAIGTFSIAYFISFIIILFNLKAYVRNSRNLSF